MVDSVPEISKGEGLVIEDNPSPKNNLNKLYPAKGWFFTWNNYPKNWEVFLDNPKIEKYIAGEEIGESGTPHIQGNLSLKSKGRPHKLFPQGVWWQKTRFEDSANEYCMKDGRFISKGIYRPFVQTISDFYHWEEVILKILKTNPDDRLIYWFYEEQGGAGKTTFCKYLLTNMDHVMILGGKASDMKYAIVKYKEHKQFLPKIIIIDVARCSDLDYRGLEDIKNMMFFCGKYETDMICGEAPHVFVFANKKPLYEKLSIDRWMVYDIVNDQFEDGIKNGVWTPPSENVSLSIDS